MALLETRKLNKRFGGLQVTADVDFVLEPGELHCLIGPNGAGKSTLFRLILGEYQPDERPDFLRRRAISRSWSRTTNPARHQRQIPGARYLQGAEREAKSRDRTAASSRRRLSCESEIERQLDFLNLTADAGQPAGNLSHGQKQWLEIGMATSLEAEALAVGRADRGHVAGGDSRDRRDGARA